MKYGFNGFILFKPAILVQDPDNRLTNIGGRVDLGGEERTSDNS